MGGKANIQNPVVSVFVYSDGSVSVGISGFSGVNNTKTIAKDLQEIPVHRFLNNYTK